ncbi:hypothetical protein Agub_g3924, partial [Astrephomene gubernaculifera]
MNMRAAHILEKGKASSGGRHGVQRPCSAKVCSAFHGHAFKRHLSTARFFSGQRDPSPAGLVRFACCAVPGSPQQAAATLTSAPLHPQGQQSPLASNNSATSQPPPLEPQPQPQLQQPPPPTDDPTWRSAERVLRLTTLVETRRLYRNCIRALHLLSLPSPLYTPPQQQQAAAEEEQQQQQQADDITPGTPGAGDNIDLDAVEDYYGDDGPTGSPPSSPSSSNSSGSSLIRARLLGGSLASSEEDKALKGALEAVAEMALVAEQLKASLRALPAGFGALIFAPGSEAASEERVRAVARRHAADLRERLGAELPLLPVTSETAQAYIEARNAKYSRRVALDELQGGSGGGGGGSTAGVGGGGGELGGSPSTSPSGRASALERLEAAERVAGEIIANNIKPALKKASEQDLLQVARDAGGYLRDLWVRLNGGRTQAGQLAALAAGLDLPRPVGRQGEREMTISQLVLDLEALEKQLQEASKSRENKLRKAGLQGRVQMAIQLRSLDARVALLSSSLAVRTLQLEMEHVYGSLEAEALDFLNGVLRGGLLARDGSTTELALLVAEFALLDEQLSLLAAALEGGEQQGHAAGQEA